MTKQSVILVVMGTRPEAIKLAPVIEQLRLDPQLRTVVCATGQHREMLDQVLNVFSIRPDYDLNVMKENQSPLETAAAVFERLAPVLEKERPDCLIVQGDTTTTFAAAWTAYHKRVRVAHVEAGLRTFDKYGPFPEELNRQTVSRIADIHFAPTARAVANLRMEGIPADRILLTGNTVVDALLKILRTPVQVPDLLARLEGRVVVVTVHRRENHGAPLERVCEAICELERRYEDLTFVVTVHCNPAVRGVLRGRLSGRERVLLSDPLDYVSFVHLIERATLILSDSGGIQEEAPTVGTPVLVLRESTERPEAIESGWARLVGTDPSKIVREACSLLGDGKERSLPVNGGNPFGDGKAGQRIARAVRSIGAFDSAIKSRRASYIASPGAYWKST